jgi:hypothetical protein
VAAAKTPPPVAVGSPPLSPFYMLLSIVNTHLCCAAVLPVFSPIIYVITYSDGLCHSTDIFIIFQLAANVVYLRSLDNLIYNNAFIIKIIIHKNGITIGLKALMDIKA